MESVGVTKSYATLKFDIILHWNLNVGVIRLWCIGIQPIPPAFQDIFLIILKQMKLSLSLQINMVQCVGLNSTQTNSTTWTFLIHTIDTNTSNGHTTTDGQDTNRTQQLYDWTLVILYWNVLNALKHTLIYIHAANIQMIAYLHLHLFI